MKISQAAGSIGAGKYVVFGNLGRGGMAEIQLGAAQGPKGFTKLVVVKKLRPLLADDQAIVSMFMDEARLAARLNHPNVVHTYEFGEELGSYFIVMEYLDGQSLHELLQAVGFSKKVKPALWGKIVSNALAGLHYAHELRDYDGTPLNVVHRDVSPQNIVVTYDGRVKLVDFGIAKATVNTAKTESQIIKGKLAYMAPEQADPSDGTELDRRADIFAMGIVLWECLTGKRLITGDARQAMSKIIDMEFVAPSKIDPEVAPELDAITLRALERNLDKRYQTAEEMHDALEHYLRATGDFVGDKEVGQLVSGLFTREREEARKQIRAHMAALTARRSPNNDDTLNELPSASLLAELGISSSGADSPVGFSITDSVQSLRAVRTSGSHPVAETRTSWAVRMAAVAAMSVVVVFGLIAVKRGPQTLGAQRSAGVATASAAPVVPAVPLVTRLVVRATPADSLISLDGAPVANPFIGSFDRDEVEHRIQVTRSGYITETKLVRLDQDDLAVEMILEKAVEQAPAPSAAPTKPGPSAPAPPGAPPVAKKRPTLDDDPWK